ncbi:phospho-N-acetylmuramoyl-pentapeptide-transferase [Lactococcus piscium]|uniref:phospho-N-acetylmuramoyl-pentapeptide- transferase n=1 Tax=Pseudolactococcus carnosus TaxID=2749961 RepID=UPI001FB87969|nr:phospho-N-acetylmuramoyl-pentapeptide-transferase [Lactococcus carnosus]MBR6895156.1 phospho-N-acetylmuramoyl-pentapeptide-transferase [Lactococcus sp.]MCJ1974634.1 phospho-N-acetylmuramoyl-pentapeptide-transferase [Lactococcus carnosus]MCJ1978737.1 phospho-N-acetylmuramoyl-pentapeptide-transferase [Lactococcus carnosus]MCJ1985016.1 phospho-N-acetylmuramoyl-pentapeptide-transferase [Lactococcus carnosus]MCJ1990917.1 phospho-N-acetylmuramoyl-pentapeptide-transferase [Lactococcus carnosus]
MFYSLIAAAVAFIVTLFTIPSFIRFYHKAKIGGQQMHEDVKQHAAKAGTPTMGGVVFVTVSLVIALLFALVSSLLTANFMILWFVFAMFAVVGFLDDFLKIFKQINQGLTSLQKLVAQIITGIIAYLIYVHEAGDNLLNVFGYQIELGVFFVVFLVFWLVGFSNAVNLTDGIDGLATMSVVISLIAYAIIAIHQKQFDILLVILVIIGSLLAFFLFNHKPAKIFMGDVGSLALGGVLGTISILLNVEWTLLLIGIVYVFETVSVMLQVSYFKLTHGKRIFRMTPVHHHFELGGFSGKGKPWSEWRVDSFFWSISLIGSVLALLIYFLQN